MIAQCILIISLVLININAKKSPTSKLTGVIQLNRHGARTPENFPDLIENIYFGSSETMLTVNGFRQCELLGQWIAERYIDQKKLLDKEYKKGEIIFKVSPEARTIFSAASFVKGIYPKSRVKAVFKSNGEEKMKNDDIPPIKNFKLREKYPQVNIIINDPDNDPIFHSSTCRLEKNTPELKHLLNKTHFYDFTEEEIIFAIEEIRPQLPWAFTNTTYEQVYSTHFLKILNSYIRPTQYHFDNKFFNLSEITNNVLNKIQIGKWYEPRLETTPIVRLIDSGLLHDFVRHMKGFINKSDTKYVFYSGHDANIISVLTVLLDKNYIMTMMSDLNTYFDFLQPPFASAFIFELHKYNDIKFFSGKKYFVKVIYNGEEIKEGFKEGLTYDEEYKGIDFESFNQFMMGYIDMNYENLYCVKDVPVRSSELI
jgi:hypothetical protein